MTVKLSEWKHSALYRMNRCSNSGFQGLKGSMGSTLKKFFFKSVPWRKELVASVTDVGLVTKGISKHT